MSSSLQDRYANALLGVFGTPQRVLERGKGAHVWDTEGREYLDLLAGIAVNALGHAHPAVVDAVSRQWNTLAHVSNFFATEPQIRLAEKLLALSGAPAGSGVYFGNSGAEANETAFKIARRHGGPQRDRILALEGAFHGRTMGALALTAKTTYREPFEPLPSGVTHLPFGDLAALEEALDERTAALVLEPVQGEAGVRPLPEGYLAAARRLTREHGALLIVDEVQTGIGRTGEWFAFQRQLQGPDASGDLPDVITLAKGLGAGYPIGAVITVGAAVSGLLTAGSHGTTFGGNPAAAAAALATLQEIEDAGLLAHVRTVSEAITDGLAALGDERITAVRAAGLLIAIDLAPDETAAPGAPVAKRAVEAALEQGFIVNAVAPGTLRLAPPLILTAEEAAGFVAALPAILDAAGQAATPAGPREGEQS
ncbi:acetylornithine transaminase [Sediminivirga luteola]|uniref:Acetylornithine aminotransferase n=1 Tax=Sediminivirga luteola TaxID=1774748 RepID=A0A8J2XLU1_9MICO|nr:acetylornithine transaminase [Sediminivirga luteola]MCI2265313.1 acetylornithine transaminase [Sediminivirga luteola]GGA24927.1 acetylornithine aminotransferase [Sediminivirga luteola]